MPSACLTEAQKAEAKVLHVEHRWPTADIGDHFGVSYRTINRALLGMGVTPTHSQPVLRMKQCSCCLRFLPMGLFGFKDTTRTGRHSWCNSCTNHPKPAPWQTNPAPLTQALSTWRN